MLNKNSLSHRVLVLLILVAFIANPSFAAKKGTAVKRSVPPPEKSVIPVEMDYASLVEKVLPCIVRITTDTLTTGSGFFVSDKGDILTNYHVIKGAREIFVTPDKGLAIDAVIKYIDEEGDMALLFVDNLKDMPFLKISQTLPRQGEAIMAVGNPYGLENTISNGIVSAFRQNKKWIQFTAPVSSGSSGGALINAKGEVVGMPTMLYKEGQNLNFAIAPNILRKFLEEALPKKISQKKPDFDPIKLLHVDAAQGSAGAQYFLGAAYRTGDITINEVNIPRDDRWAAFWFSRAAEQEYIEAYSQLADMYYLGEGVPQDYKQAFYWHLKAARQGNVRSQYCVGLMYAKARGVQQDYEQAQHWYLKAAEQGYANAQVNLGAMYYNGNGVKKDYQKCLYWYRKATNNNHELAQLYLGYMYEDGEGVKRDIKQAVEWYRKSAKQGNQNAKNILAEMGIYDY